MEKKLYSILLKKNSRMTILTIGKKIRVRVVKMLTKGNRVKNGVIMIRYCTICDNTFGCIMNDGEKLECLTCNYFKNCFSRQLKTPQKKDMAEGVCGLCLLELRISKEQWYSNSM